jgi:disulfide bond formation protein DsbB
MTTFSFRQLCAAGLGVCAFGIAFALYLQSRGYEPCPMCIFQRVAMIATGLVFALGLLIGPRGVGRYLIAGLATITAAIGAGISGRQVWLQHLPEDQVPACGPTLDYLMDMFPLADVVKMILQGDGSCARIDAQWLGITLPGWTLIAFIGIGLFAAALPYLAHRVAR